MKIKFTSIKIENFKNIDLLETKFGEKTFVYGANEAGKTSFSDAISWCLTGKNSLGDSQFNFVPIGKTGVSPSVTLEIDISGKVKDMADHCILQRVYQAKQNRSKEFTGEYQTVCYVNRLKVGVREFEDWISTNICDSDVFRLIHDVRYFTENISVRGKERPWEAQRRLLFSISGIKPDFEFVRSKKRFEPILEGLRNYDNASQYMIFLKSEEKRFVDEIRYHNARIEMAKSTLESCGETDEDIDSKIKELKIKVTNLDTEIEQETKKLRSEREKKVAAIKRLYNEKVSEFKKEQEEYSMKFEELTDRRKKLSGANVDAHCSISSARIELKNLQDEYNNIDIQCPTCGQYIPEEMIAEKKAELEKRIKALQEQVDLLTIEGKNIENELSEADKGLSVLRPPVYPEELRDIQNQLTVAETMETTISGKKLSEIRKELIEDLNSLMDKKHVSERNRKTKETIKNIEEEVSRLLDLRANNSKMIDLVKDFIDAKCVYAEKKINGLFDGIEFKLFRKNKTNNEIVSTCDIFWNKTPYQSLSYSTKFIVSMNIALAFQKHYKVELPLVIDNSESIDIGAALPVQSIMLIKRDEVCLNCGKPVGRKQSDGMWHCANCNMPMKKTLEIVTK